MLGTKASHYFVTESARKNFHVWREGLESVFSACTHSARQVTQAYSYMAIWAVWSLHKSFHTFSESGIYGCKAQKNPGWDATPSQGTLTHHSLTPVGSLVITVKLSVFFLDCGEKAKYSEETPELQGEIPHTRNPVGDLNPGPRGLR